MDRMGLENRKAKMVRIFYFPTPILPIHVNECFTLILISIPFPWGAWTAAVALTPGV